MQKLIAAYRANPTLENARKLRAYEMKHTMAVCMLPICDINTLERAFEQIEAAKVAA